MQQKCEWNVDTFGKTVSRDEVNYIQKDVIWNEMKNKICVLKKDE